MDTRKIASEHRLKHWAEILRDRQTSGESIKGYCARMGICENVYYYWQRKLREAACREMLPAQSMDKLAVVPRGWAVCRQEKEAVRVSEAVVIEIGKCRVEATADFDTELLSKVCRTLIALC
jgi:putative transposase